MLFVFEVSFSSRNRIVFDYFFSELWDVLPPGLPARHPLQGEWTLWYLKGDRSKDWVECLREVVTFDSIEGFWRLICFIFLQLILFL